MERLLDAAHKWRNDRIAIATVVSTWGSAPRPRGSHMLINEDGRFEGSVSGGCVEGAILNLAQQVIDDRKACLRRFGVADAAAWEVGLPCGGEISVLIQPVGRDGFPSDLLDSIGEARKRGERLVISTDLESGRSQAHEAGAFINHYNPPRRLIVIGAVQIAQSLIMLAKRLDIRPVLVDPRSRFLTSERFPGVELDDRWPDEAITGRSPDMSTAVVTLSHDPKIDDPALTAALCTQAGYIGALGSRKSHAARLDRLRAQGFEERDLARIDGPAGIDIGSIAPAEIALSILAGIVRTFNDPG